MLRGRPLKNYATEKSRNSLPAFIKGCLLKGVALRDRLEPGKLRLNKYFHHSITALFNERHFTGEKNRLRAAGFEPVKINAAG